MGCSNGIDGGIRREEETESKGETDKQWNINGDWGMFQSRNRAEHLMELWSEAALSKSW